jgi:hypothetical protein
VYVGA